jgi:amino acid transporter
VREATGLTRALSGWDALIGNIMSMGIAFVFVYAYFASLLYPGVNLPLTVGVALLPGIVFSIVYYLFTVAMPRTGGDYVWVSRIVHPAVGYLGNFFITFTLFTIVGTVAAWVPIYGLGPLFVGLGLIRGGNSEYLTLAFKLSSPPFSFAIAAVLVVLFVVPLFFSLKSTYRLLWVLFVITAIGTLVMVAAYFSSSQGAFASNFNSLTNMNYAKTISIAGLPSGFTVQMTLTGSVFTILNFIGFNFSAYYTGEVKEVKRGQIIAMIGSLFLFALFMALVYTSAYHAAGSDFLNAASYLFATGNGNYTLPAPPVLNLLVTFASPTPLVILATGIGFIAACVAEITVLSFVGGRNFFAWSFDRLMPSWLVRLDSKRGSPYIISIATMILGIIFAWLYIYTIFFQFLAYAVVNALITFGITSVAAIIFPFKAKNIFDTSPPVVRRKIGKIPVISLLGIAGVILASYLSYATLQPAVTPPPSSVPLINLLAYVFIPLTGAIALVIYTVAYYYRKSRGIDIGLVFREIPPE